MQPKSIALIAGPLAGLAVGGWLLAAGHAFGIGWTAGLTVWVAVWWMWEPVPIPATSLLPFALLPLGGVLTHTKVSEAYGHTLILLMLAGAILSQAMEKSGSHRRVALMLLKVIGGSSGRRVVLGFMVAAALLSMWISNVATALMLLPVAMAVLEQTEERQKLGGPLMLGLAYAVSIGGMGTPVGTPPNVIFIAQYHAFTGQDWSFFRWMLIGVPVVVLFTPVAWLWLVRRLPATGPIAIPDLGPWRSEERRTLAVFALTAVLWITRSEPWGGWNGVIERLFDFQSSGGDNSLIGDSTVAIFMTVMLFVLPNGHGGRLLDWEQAKQIPWGLFLLFAGGIAISMAFKESGLSQEVGKLLSGITTWGPIPVMILVCLVLTFLTEITSNTATTSVMLPVLAGACQGPDGSWLFPPEQMMIPATISASCAFMLPVATPPNAIVFGTGYIPLRMMVREGLMMNLIGVVIVTAVCYVVLVWAGG